MADRERVVATWQARLAAWRQRLEAGRSSRPWVARAYVRVLSYLLASYGAGRPSAAGRGAVGEASSLGKEPDDIGSQMPFYQAPGVEAGKPARSGGDIRGVLETVRQSQRQQESAGPLAGGLPGAEWIALAAFYSPAEVDRLRQMLLAAGISVRVERARRMQQVSVRVADMHRAKPIVLAHAADSHDSSRYRKSRMVGWTRIGKLCGFVLGAIISAVWTWAAGMSEPPIYVLFGFLGGLLGLMAGAAIGFLAGTIADA